VARTEGAGERRPYRSQVREERARRTRRKVLDAATEVFVARGYAGTTVRSVALAAGVSVATVELAFGTKAALLKAAIDVAIAGDDEPVPVLERSWAATAAAATSAEELLAVTAEVLAEAQERSAGLVVAAFEGAGADPDLAALVDQLVAQREGTAEWIVARLAALRDLRAGLTREDAVETVWLLMDSAVFVRLTRHRGWTRQRYRDWVATGIRTLLLPDAPPPAPARVGRPRPKDVT
jgi:AcrR family transcriptional regulator